MRDAGVVYQTIDSDHGIFLRFLLDYGTHLINRRVGESYHRGREIEHGSFWLGDLVIVCINKAEKGKRRINLEVSFPDRVNLECISHSLNDQYTALPLSDLQHLLIIFEKVDLTGETALGKYFIETF